MQRTAFFLTRHVAARRGNCFTSVRCTLQKRQLYRQLYAVYSDNAMPQTVPARWAFCQRIWGNTGENPTFTARSAADRVSLGPGSWALATNACGHMKFLLSFYHITNNSFSATTRPEISGVSCIDPHIFRTRAIDSDYLNAIGIHSWTTLRYNLQRGFWTLSIIRNSK
jgi:hypothetical protein